MAALTFERANELVALAPDGSLLRKTGASAGRVAGTRMRDGYRRVWVDGKAYPEHWIVWLLANGRWHEGQVDHINGIRDDNRPCNLREATPAQNSTNRRGVTGVTKHKSGKFQAQIKHLGKGYYLGLHDTREAAEAAYREASLRLHGEFGSAA